MGRKLLLEHYYFNKTNWPVYKTLRNIIYPVLKAVNCLQFPGRDGSNPQWNLCVTSIKQNLCSQSILGAFMKAIVLSCASDIISQHSLQSCSFAFFPPPLQRYSLIFEWGFQMSPSRKNAQQSLNVTLTSMSFFFVCHPQKRKLHLSRVRTMQIIGYENNRVENKQTP